MKKVVFALVILFTLGACLPFDIPGLATPTAVIQATFTSSSVPPETPTATFFPVEFTVTPVSASVSPTTEITLSPSATPPPPADLTTTPVTATNLPVNLTATVAGVTTIPGQPTLTPTLGILRYGTLPPAVPFNTVTIWNKSKAQAYISLQVTLNDGRYAILEYPVERIVNVKAPLGNYIYVAWVGGKKMVGSFKLTSTSDLTITLFKDKVVIQ